MVMPPHPKKIKRVRRTKKQPEGKVRRLAMLLVKTLVQESLRKRGKTQRRNQVKRQRVPELRLQEKETGLRVTAQLRRQRYPRRARATMAGPKDWEMAMLHLKAMERQTRPKQPSKRQAGSPRMPRWYLKRMAKGQARLRVGRGMAMPQTLRQTLRLAAKIRKEKEKG